MNISRSETMSGEIRNPKKSENICENISLRNRGGKVFPYKNV